MSEQAPRLIFRIQREDQSGTRTTEERELVGCTAEDLMKYLCAPWEEMPEGESQGSGNATDPLAERIERYFRDLQLVVTERRADADSRTFILGFQRISNPSRSEPLAEAQIGKDEKLPVQLAGKLEFQVRSDRGEHEVEVNCSDSQSGIQVNNRALLLIHKNNLYANIHVHLFLTINSI